MRILSIIGLLVVSFAIPAQSAPLCDKLGFAGLLAKCNRETLPPITLASGKPLAEKPLQLQSGAYYKIDFVSDGSAELAIAGPEFFRAIWVNEVVINDLEIRPLGLDSFEFDDEGVIHMSFIAIKPGRYELKIPGSSGESQRVQISIQ
ncbi:hypothetical protein [Hwanghaeella sp.]|uniref:hypothetical protein n=1 Tax=Hwanghaeella sp. TaxID=2605943 RepID=UPI003CCB787B